MGDQGRTHPLGLEGESLPFTFSLPLPLEAFLGQAEHARPQEGDTEAQGEPWRAGEGHGGPWRAREGQGGPGRAREVRATGSEPQVHPRAP